MPVGIIGNEFNQSAVRANQTWAINESNIIMVLQLLLVPSLYIFFCVTPLKVYKRYSISMGIIILVLATIK